jgi:hypothetical protein
LLLRKATNGQTDLSAQLFAAQLENMKLKMEMRQKGLGISKFETRNQRKEGHGIQIFFFRLVSLETGFDCGGIKSNPFMFNLPI